MSKPSGYLNTVTTSKLLPTAALASERLVLEYPDEGELRSRTVVSRSRARSTGKYPSWKMGRMIQCESLNELNVARLLDADPEITAFNEQPLTIYYSLNGATHRHYPDFNVEWRNGVRELWEIKPAAQATLSDVLQRTRYLQEALPRTGFKYCMMIAEDVRVGPQLGNAIRLLRHGRTPVSSAEREQVRQILLCASSVSWGSARRGDLGLRGQCVLARLTLEGFLTFNRSIGIDDNTEFILALRRRKGQ